jgi:hypothetical protein
MSHLTATGPARFALIMAAALAGTTTAEAQTPGTYTQGNCVYTAGSSAPLGCYFAMAGRTWYLQAANGAIRDEATGLWLSADAVGNWYIYTTQGWHLASVHPTGRWLLEQMGVANQGTTVVVGPGNAGPLVGAWNLAETARASGDSDAARVFEKVLESNDRMTATWTAPACTGSYNGC